jgi:hypothetical protein
MGRQPVVTLTHPFRPARHPSCSFHPHPRTRSPYNTRSLRSGKASHINVLSRHVAVVSPYVAPNVHLNIPCLALLPATPNMVNASSLHRYLSAADITHVMLLYSLEMILKRNDLLCHVRPYQQHKKIIKCLRMEALEIVKSGIVQMNH